MSKYLFSFQGYSSLQSMQISPLRLRTFILWGWQVTVTNITDEFVAL